MPINPAELIERSRRNLDRVRDLVALYGRLAGTVAGRPSIQESDILRAAVVLLHSTLEDFLRFVAMNRLPAAGAEVLKQVPFPGGDGRKTTFTLGDLAAYRGSSVDEVIASSVKTYLARSSYNNTDELAKLLTDVGLPPSLMRPYASHLATMMARRHLIVHRVDGNEQSGRGHHQAHSISKAIVQAWIAAVEGIILDIQRRL
jgi:hypothetical protein